jgi:hypothetical protein
VTYTIIKSNKQEFDIADSKSYISKLSATTIQEAIQNYTRESIPLKDTVIKIVDHEVLYTSEYDNYGYVVGIVDSLDNIEKEYPELFI